MATQSIELSSGTIEYVDTGGNGPVIVFVHGLLMDATLWDAVIADLRQDYRCVAPTLPLGAHSQPMPADADLSMPGVAGMVAELIERLDLRDVTLVGNDTGGAIVQLVVGGNTERLARISLISCDAFDNYPPKLAGVTLVLTGKLPPTLFGLFMQQLRLKPMRRMPISFGWLTKRGDADTKRWLAGIWGRPEIRRDIVRSLRTIPAERNLLVEAAKALPSFDRPALVVWAQKDRIMPPAHGRRLAELFPQGKLVEVPDSYTLVPLDQPAALTKALRDFLAS